MAWLKAPQSPATIKRISMSINVMTRCTLLPQCQDGVDKVCRIYDCLQAFALDPFSCHVARSAFVCIHLEIHLAHIFSRDGAAELSHHLLDHWLASKSVLPNQKD